MINESMTVSAEKMKGLLAEWLIFRLPLRKK